MLVAPARATTTLGPATQLFVADHRQYRPQVFVVSDGALVDLANLIEGMICQLDTIARNRKPSRSRCTPNHDRAPSLMSRRSVYQKVLGG